MTQRMGPSSLRTAGVGVLVGGMLLIVLAATIAELLAVGSILTVAICCELLTGTKHPWGRQVSLGIGAVGLLALVETRTNIGLGLGLVELGVFAIIFGLFDIVIGTVLRQIRAETTRD